MIQKSRRRSAVESENHHYEVVLQQGDQTIVVGVALKLEDATLIARRAASNMSLTERVGEDERYVAFDEPSGVMAVRLEITSVSNEATSYKELQRLIAKRPGVIAYVTLDARMYYGGTVARL